MESKEQIALKSIKEARKPGKTILDLSGLRLEILSPEIGRPSNLISLDLSDNILSELPKQIEKLTNLTTLNLANNQFTDVPIEILNLDKLTSLDLSNNRLTTLPIQIEKLTNLTSLYLSGNEIKNIPVEIGRLTNLNKLDIRGNKLDIPPEISEKVNEPKSILNYFSWVLEGKRKPLSETKILVVGQGSVGKTSLIKRMIFDNYSPHEAKTQGISITSWQVNSELETQHQQFITKLNIWDFGGQEIMHATHQFFLTKRSLYLLVVDSRLTQEENRVEYWLKIIQSFGGDSPVLIVGNKTDEHPLDMDQTGLRKKYSNIVDILAVSAKDGSGIEQLQSAIVKQVSHNLPHIHDLIPETWFKVKTQLERLGHEQNFITHDRYLDLCAANEISDETSQHTLIGFLHDLGVVLHFQDDPRLEALGILNPQWVTNGVYKILNSHILFQNKGVLTISMLDEILDPPDYPRGKSLFIVDMMRKFELCYDIDSETFLVPDLLPKDEPFTGEWVKALAFQYHYNVLPTSIISRFIVRMNTYVHQPTTWRSGTVLKKGGNTALVKADTEDKRIFIWVNGDESTRRDFLAAIRTEFDTIHKTITKIEATEKVPHPIYSELILDYNELIQFERDRIEKFPKSVNGKTILVNVPELLNGIRRESEYHNTENLIDVNRGNDSNDDLAIEDAINEVSQPESTSDILVQKRPLLYRILLTVVVNIPRIIGRAFLDIFGRGKDSADTTSVLIGYVLIILVMLALWGIVDINSQIDLFTRWWRFFFPVK